MKNSCANCRFFFRAGSGAVCVNLKAPFIYDVGSTAKPEETICEQWRGLDPRPRVVAEEAAHETPALAN